MCLCASLFSTDGGFCNGLKRKRQASQLRKCLRKAGLIDGLTRTNPPQVHSPTARENQAHQQDPQRPQAKEVSQPELSTKPPTTQQNIQKPHAIEPPTSPNPNNDPKRFGSESTMGGPPPRPASTHDRRSRASSAATANGANSEPAEQGRPNSRASTNSRRASGDESRRSINSTAESPLRGIQPPPASAHSGRSRVSSTDTANGAPSEPAEGARTNSRGSTSSGRAGGDETTRAIDATAESTNAETADASSEGPSLETPETGESSNPAFEPLSSGRKRKANPTGLKRLSDASEAVSFDDDHRESTESKAESIKSQAISFEDDHPKSTEPKGKGIELQPATSDDELSKSKPESARSPDIASSDDQAEPTEALSNTDIRDFAPTTTGTSNQNAIQNVSNWRKSLGMIPMPPVLTSNAEYSPFSQWKWVTERGPLKDSTVSDDTPRFQKSESSSTASPAPGSSRSGTARDQYISFESTAPFTHPDPNAAVEHKEQTQEDSCKVSDSQSLSEDHVSLRGRGGGPLLKHTKDQLKNIFQRVRDKISKVKRKCIKRIKHGKSSPRSHTSSGSAELAVGISRWSN